MSDSFFQLVHRTGNDRLPFLWAVWMAFVLVLAGCASTENAGDAQPRLTLAADKAALENESSIPARDQARTAAGQSDLSMVAVPLQGAIRRLVSVAIEQAAAGQGESAGPRAAVVVPASSSGLQPPGLSAASAAEIARGQISKDFPGLRLLDEDDRLLPQADWALLMQIALGEQDRLCVRVLDMNSGRVLAAQQQRLSRDSINRVPTRYFRDLPVVLPWPDALAIASTCGSDEAVPAAQPDQNIDWRARIRLQMVFSSASQLYGQRDHRAALKQFRQLRKLAAAATAAGHTLVGNQIALHGQLGEYLSTWRRVFNRGAEYLMQPLIRALFAFDNELALNLSFSPVDEGIIAGRRMRSRQTEWLIEVSRYLRRLRACAKIVGHAGNEFAADPRMDEPLGLKHAEYVRRQLRRHSKFSPSALVSRPPLARERMPIALTGDIRDEWARRVSIIKLDCREMSNER